MPPDPSVDESFAGLHAAGWSVGETGTAGGWFVSGTNGENAVNARGRTQAEAWHRACEQAAAVGMLVAVGAPGGKWPMSPGELLLYYLPSFRLYVAWLVGGMLALVHWQRHPKGSAVMVVATVLFVLRSL